MKKSKTLCLCGLVAFALTACSDDDVTPAYDVNINSTLPTELPDSYTVKSCALKLTEINTGIVTNLDILATPNPSIQAGTYNVEGQMTVDADGRELTLRAVASQIVVTDATSRINLSWFFFNPENTLIFSEIFITGSLNAKGTGGLYDSYFKIYNNTDEVIFADGLAIVESKLLNTFKDEITTPEALPSANFTAQTIYVIPGNGADVAIRPGESIKIVDQAINWGEQVTGALDHRDANFEWYDEVTSGYVRDTDNPSVPNLDKWYSYSNTIWLPSQQCNRSYALVRFPKGMTAEKFLADFKGDYTYITAATGKEMTGTKCYRIPYDWILDGVNLCPTEVYTTSALSPTIDMSYAAISEKNSDKTRFGKAFMRRQAGISAAGISILMDTNDSAKDFEIVALN